MMTFNYYLAQALETYTDIYGTEHPVTFGDLKYLIDQAKELEKEAERQIEENYNPQGAWDD